MRMVAIAAAAAVSTTTKTFVQVGAGTNHPIKITEIGISFDGNDNLAKPVIIELCIQDTNGTSSSLTLAKVEESHSGTTDSSGAETFTAEPTTSTVIRKWSVHPQGVPWVYTVPDPKAMEISGGSYVGIRATLESGESAVNITPYIEFEE